MPDEWHIAGPQRFLIDGGCGHGIDLSGIRQLDRFGDVFEGCLTAQGRNFAGGKSFGICIGQVDQVQYAGLIHDLVRACYRMDAQRQLADLHGSGQNPLVTDDQTNGRFLDLLVGDRLDDDFRTDTGWIAHGNSNQWFVHIGPRFSQIDWIIIKRLDLPGIIPGLRFWPTGSQHSG